MILVWWGFIFPYKYCITKLKFTDLDMLLPGCFHLSDKRAMKLFFAWNNFLYKSIITFYFLFTQHCFLKLTEQEWNDNTKTNNDTHRVTNECNHRSDSICLKLFNLGKVSQCALKTMLKNDIGTICIWWCFLFEADNFLNYHHIYSLFLCRWKKWIKGVHLFS